MKELMRKIFLEILGRYDSARKTFWTGMERIHFLVMGISFGKNFRTRGHIIVYNRGKVTIGDNVTINSSGWSNPIGGGEHTYIQVFPQGSISIGNGVGISNTALTSRAKIEIHDHVLIGAGCKIYDTDFHPLEDFYRYGPQKDNSHIASKGIVIEEGVFIGGGSYILKGAHIGRNAIVGASSVVTGIIPEGEIWAGNPARFIKKAPGY